MRSVARVATQSAPGGIGSGPTGWRGLGAGLLIFGATLLAYLPAIHGGLLWDDDAHVTKPELRSLDGLRRIWLEPGASQQYYPLLHSAFWVEHRLWGDATLGYHLLNLLLHATAACLVAALVRRFFDGGTGLLAGLIFALHPVCVESVAWIAEQKNTLSAVFYLAAAWTYLGFDRDRRRSQYLLALGWFVLALLSKTVTATLPAALLVVLWWRRGRLDWRRDVRPLVPWFVLGVAGGLVTAWVEQKFFVSVQERLGPAATDFALTFLERCLLAGRVIWFYLGKLVWPADLIFIYPQWSVSAAVGWQYLFPLAVLGAIAGLAVVARRRRGPLAGFLFFAGTLFPALGFFNVYPFLFSYVADHFQYLASLGILVPLAVGLTAGVRRLLAGRAAGVRRLGAVLVGVVPAVLGVLTWRQCGMYRDAETLYRATLARNPTCWLAHANLGLILAAAPGGLPEALAHFEAAVRLKPGDAELHNQLGSALARVPGREAAAIDQFETALRLSPDLPYPHANLGIALLRIPGRLPEAVAQLETAVRLKPDFAAAYNFLGRALGALPGHEGDALAAYAAALRIDPGLADAHSNLAITLAAMPGRMPEAIEHFAAAARLDPGSADAHYNLGCALAAAPGRLPDAVGEFAAALRIDPANARAHLALGMALAGLPGRAREARAQFEAVLRLDPEDADARRGLEQLRAAPPPGGG